MELSVFSAVRCKSFNDVFGNKVLLLLIVGVWVISSVLVLFFLKLR